jgi:hypothetical protein
VSIMKSVRNLIFYLHYCFWNFSQFLAIYFERFSSGVILIRKTLTKWVPPVRRRCLRWAHLAARHCRVAATCHACALNVMSGPRAGVPTAPRRSDCAPFRPHRRRCPNLLASPRPVPTTPSPLSKAAPPPCLNPGAVRPSDAVASFIHGVHRTSSPLAVLHPWSVELTFPSLLSVAGPPSATVAHLVGKTLPPSRISSPHRRRGAPVSYFPLPHVRQVASPSWVLDHRRLRCHCRCGVTAEPTLRAWAKRHCASGPSVVLAQWHSN